MNHHESTRRERERERDCKSAKVGKERNKVAIFCKQESNSKSSTFNNTHIHTLWGVGSRKLYTVEEDSEGK